MATTTGQIDEEIVPAPRLYSAYYASDKPRQLAWIIEETSNKLYSVPGEPGGWMRRSEYQGQSENLRAVSLPLSTFDFHL